MCQDTGTAIVMGKRGELVLTGGDDERSHQPRHRADLRDVQPALLADGPAHHVGREEHRHEPARPRSSSTPRPGDAYKLLFMAKGGGSANKSYLYQETKAVLNRSSMLKFLDEKLRTLGTSACPPYHLAVVVGGTSAEFALKTAKFASAHYLDSLPTDGLGPRPRVPRPRARAGHPRPHPGLRHRRAVRRQVLLPRRPRGPPAPPRRLVPGGRRGVVLGRPPGPRQDHRATACSSSSSRRTPPATCPRSPTTTSRDDDVVRIDLNRPMDEIRAELTRYPVKTRLSLTGPMVVARDIAHAKIKERLDAGEPMPAVPARPLRVLRRPGQDARRAYASGSFGPTTAGRMDSYVAARSRPPAARS